jgi:hypothetical protein
LALSAFNKRAAFSFFLILDRLAITLKTSYLNPEVQRHFITRNNCTFNENANPLARISIKNQLKIQTHQSGIKIPSLKTNQKRTPRREQQHTTKQD